MNGRSANAPSGNTVSWCPRIRTPGRPPPDQCTCGPAGLSTIVAGRPVRSAISAARFSADRAQRLDLERRRLDLDQPLEIGNERCEVCHGATVPARPSAERLAAGLTSHSRRCGVDGVASRTHPPRSRRRTTARRRSSSWSRVELFPFAHAFRAGSRIRLTVDAPGGNRPVWEFDTIAGGEQVTIAHDATFPSQLVLPVVAGVDVPAGYPDCDASADNPAARTPARDSPLAARRVDRRLGLPAAGIGHNRQPATLGATSTRHRERGTTGCSPALRRRLPASSVG